MAESTTSFWVRSNRPSLSYDVVVVGGGIVGCSTAYWLRRIGPELRIAIVDRQYLGSGASSRNAGFILQGTATAFASDVERFGLETAKRLFQLTLDNRNLIFDELPTKTIGAEATGSLTASGSPHEDLKLQESEVLLHECGFQATHRSASELGRLTNSSGFLGGLYLPTGAVVDPVRMLRYLAQASDVDVFEYAASENIVPEAGGVVVETERITFNAQHVLVATNAYTPLLLGPQNLPVGTIRPIRAQMLATSPVQPVLTMPVYSHDGFYYIRQHQSGRILLGGARHLHESEEVGYVDSVTAGLQSDLEEYLGVHFPDVRPNEIESRWSGTMGFSPDSRPLFSSIRDVPGAYWIGGFTGHGMSVAFRAGLLAARSVLGRDDEYADLFDAARLTK